MNSRKVCNTLVFRAWDALLVQKLIFRQEIWRIFFKRIFYYFCVKWKFHVLVVTPKKHHVMALLIVVTTLSILVFDMAAVTEQSTFQNVFLNGRLEYRADFSFVEFFPVNFCTLSLKGTEKVSNSALPKQRTPVFYLTLFSWCLSARFIGGRNCCSSHFMYFEFFCHFQNFGGSYI